MSVIIKYCHTCDNCKCSIESDSMQNAPDGWSFFEKRLGENKIMVKELCFSCQNKATFVEIFNLEK